MTNPRRDLRPTEVVRPVDPRDVHVDAHEEVVRRPVAHQEEVVERGDSRVRGVRVTCAVIDVVCWLFAIVLAVHVFLVVAGANPANGFAQLIDGWSAGVSLGLRDLFTPANDALRTLLNDGLAAVLWLLIGAGLTSLITRLALPAGERRVWYRRTVR
ncbi:hypothetical protein GCM10022243_38270 [Saccharothrix violaceirubra]|uniref:Uncharacterized protein n=1 Tax=Saccharothrix violaceirubra TaxID=413306 RepID=A0A7W7T0L0_9PSEU|nr:hypothetical protein [Saccharothrix violaceirubra]MBB4964388.1 hypothetical protein [Saccharothrix violaceirubra]